MKDADNALTRALLKNTRNFSFLGKVTAINIISSASARVVNGKWITTSNKRKGMLTTKGHHMLFADNKPGSKSKVKLEFTFEGENIDINELVLDVMKLQYEDKDVARPFVIARS